MSMPTSVKGGDHTTLSLTWLTSNGNAYDLSDVSSITGRIESPKGVARDMTGTLAVLVAASGTFTWQPSAADVREAGVHYVQFKANYADTTADLTERTEWEVLEAI